MDDESTLIRRNLELATLNIIAADLNREIDLGRALEIALEHVARLFGRRTGWIWLLDPGGAASLAASCSLPPALACNPERMRGDCTCLDTYRRATTERQASVGIITCSRLKGLLDGTQGLRFHASVPLYAHGHPLGVLNVAGADWQELSSDELRLLSTIGDLLSIVVERARLLARNVELAALEERNRIAREIHDTLAQRLAAITLKLEVADTLLEGNTPAERIRATLADALELARRGLDDARRSVLDLRDDPLSGKGLAEALRALAHEIEVDASLPVKVILLGDDSHLPSRVALGLYRIVQESVTNVVRHAGAQRCTLRLAPSDQRVELAIIDDGRGFDPLLLTPGRFGIVGMGERAHLLGGVLQIDSAPGAGTTVRVEVPL